MTASLTFNFRPHFFHAQPANFSNSVACGYGRWVSGSFARGGVVCMISIKVCSRFRASGYFSSIVSSGKYRFVNLRFSRGMNACNAITPSKPAIPALAMHKIGPIR